MGHQFSVVISIYPTTYQVTGLSPGPVEDPNGFDILVSDVNDPKLHKEISEMLGFQYLSRAPIFPDQKPASEIQGILYGMHNRPFFPLVTTIEGQTHPRYVHFFFDSSSPYTYFSYEVSGNCPNALLLANSLWACNCFFGSNSLPREFRANLNGHLALIRSVPASSHFKDINLLGADFCTLHGAMAQIDYRMLTAKLLFPYAHKGH
jgi:hypothetical protein